MGYDFHRQKPLDNFIVDFFCGKLALTIELDGCTNTPLNPQHSVPNTQLVGCRSISEEMKLSAGHLE